MLWIIQFIIALSFIYQTLADYGDIRIVGGTDSGPLEFDRGYYDWGVICKDGFDDHAGDVTCRQLGYIRSSDVYVAEYYYANADDISVCYTSCDGDEDELTECDIRTSACLYCNNGVVGVTCTDSLTIGAIIGIVFGVLIFIALITTIVILCICCLTPSCPCYYNKLSFRTVFVAQPVPQVVTTATAATNAAYHQTTPPPPPHVPDPAYPPQPADPGFQPYPTDQPHLAGPAYQYLNNPAYKPHPNDPAYNP